MAAGILLVFGSGLLAFGRVMTIRRGRVVRPMVYELVRHDLVGTLACEFAGSLMCLAAVVLLTTS
jgi:hypothetical protein